MQGNGRSELLKRLGFEDMVVAQVRCKSMCVCLGECVCESGVET